MSAEETEKRPIVCPYCDSANTDFFSLYGNSLLSTQYYCRGCHTIFDVVRFDDDEEKQVVK